MSATAAAYAKARSEIIALFGWNAGALSPEQTLRAECATALRLGLDELQGRLIRGESIDMARMLTASEALSRLLPPAVLAAPPAERREDPRAALLALILQMRERDGIPDEGTTRGTINAQAVEIAQLKAQLAGKAPEVSDVPTMVERVPVLRRAARAAGGMTLTPTEADVVPPGEIGEFYHGAPRPAPDDPNNSRPVPGAVVRSLRSTAADGAGGGSTFRIKG
jgi:hypothetical protein